MHEEEIAKEAREIEESLKDEKENSSRLKKIYLTVVSVVLLLLLLVYFVPGVHILNMLEGRIASSLLAEDYSFDLKFGGKVIFDKQVYEALRTMYFENQKYEFKVCLLGSKSGKDYFVKGIYVPKIFRQDVHSVSAEYCSSETVISLHTHPYLRCIFSEQDIRYFNAFRQRNSESIIALMCDHNRLTFFGYEE